MDRDVEQAFEEVVAWTSAAISKGVEGLPGIVQWVPESSEPFFGVDRSKPALQGPPSDIEWPEDAVVRLTAERGALRAEVERLTRERDEAMAASKMNFETLTKTRANLGAWPGNECVDQAANRVVNERDRARAERDAAMGENARLRRVVEAGKALAAALGRIRPCDGCSAAAEYIYDDGEAFCRKCLGSVGPDEKAVSHVAALAAWQAALDAAEVGR